MGIWGDFWNDCERSITLESGAGGLSICQRWVYNEINLSLFTFRMLRAMPQQQ